MAATLKDIVTMLERGKQPPSEPVRILTVEENEEVDRRMQELLGKNSKEEDDGSNKT